MSVVIFLLLGLLCFPGGATAQDTLKITLEGEPLSFITVRLLAEEQTGWVADVDGRVVLPVGLADTTTLRFSYLGFVDADITYGTLAAQDFNFAFPPFSTTYTAIEIMALTVIGRRNEIADDMLARVESIDRAEMDRVQTLTTADALADLSGVYVQKSQFGGGSPVLRGFEANRVLLVVDGVRMNNAIYRNGHLQNAISVDPFALDRMEVIYGSGALAYGSDAIGGVVHFRTQQPKFADYRPPGLYCIGPNDSQARPPVQWRAKGAMRYASAANTFTPALNLEYRGNDFASLTLGSIQLASHLRAGAQRPDRFPDFGRRNTYAVRENGLDREVDNDQPNVQVGTAYHQYNLLQKFRWRINPQVELNANLQFSTTSDVPRYDALTERRNGNLRWARWDYGPQTRALASLGLHDRSGNALWDGATYLLSHQFIEEDRLQRRFGDPLTEHNLVDVHTTNFTADFYRLLLDDKLTLRYGLDARYDEVVSTAFFQHVDTGVRSGNVNARYPSGGSDLRTLGGYAEGEFDLNRWWKVRGGLRYSVQQLNARFGAEDPVEWPADYLAGLRNNTDALTGSLGTIYSSDAHRLRLFYAQGFRAPNVDDFAKFRESNGFLLVPNPDLLPERSQTLEAGYRYASPSEQLQLEATVYHTWLRNAIIRRNGTFTDGAARFVSRGDTLFVQTNVNADRARVYGFDLGARWRMSNRWALTSRFHALRGRRQQQAPNGVTLTLPQDHIPPPYGQTGVRYVRQTWSAGIRARYQFAKAVEDYAVGGITLTDDGYYNFNRIGTADNLELSPLDADGNFTGTYSWWTLHLDASYTLPAGWQLGLKIDNLLDRHYRTFASGVSAPGIDVGISLQSPAF